MLEGHLKWEEEFKQLDAAIKASEEEEIPEGEEGRNKEADQQKMEELRNRIKQSIRNIVRFCYENKQEFEKLRDFFGHKKNSKIQEFASLFFQQFEIFRMKMTTSKEEEDSKQDQMKQLDEKVLEIKLDLTFSRRLKN